MKKLLSIMLILCLLAALVGCGKSGNTSSGSSANSEITSEIEDLATDGEALVNPLTGVADLKADAVKIQPVAVMVNNISLAWGVQSGLSKADVIYEAYVEGGITRLLAVFKDVRDVEKIGSLRSARYSFVDLAAGHGARFVHAGRDEDYCTPHLAELGITSVDLNSGSTSATSIGCGSVAYRESNGLATEHTLFTTGEKLYNGLKKVGVTKQKSKGKNWMNFVDEDSKYVPEDGECTELYVPFSGSYGVEFKFNKDTGLYDKYRSGSKQVDAGNGETVSVGNVLVLYSNTTAFSDGYHVKTDLSSGKGYYVSNGGYMEINWSKGSASSSFEITDADGNEIDYNPGSTYVCLTQTSNKSGTTLS